jgi:chromosome segregation ATPase
MLPKLPQLSIKDTQLLNRFITELDQTSITVEGLIHDVRASEIDLVKIQTELSSLCSNVKELSAILRGGEVNLSLVTRITLIENALKDIENDIRILQDSKADKGKLESYRQTLKSITEETSEAKVADKTGSWQFKIALVTGVVGVLGSIVTLLGTLFK